MKILVVSFADSDNLAIENVLYELEQRGHKLTIFARATDNSSLRMFSNLKAKIRNISELNNAVAKKFDVALCTNMSMGLVQTLDIYCFVYTSYIDDTFVTDGGDFIFTFRDRQLPNINFKSAFMAVGNPRNDKKIYNNEIAENSKRILYIDSGHMPFGSKGKKQIANMILEVCSAFPDYEICIKPRWLRNSTSHFTHKNKEHIYDIIEEICQGNIPENLNMLEQHLDLQELIDSSTSVITLYSAAHLDVIMKNKGLLILSGWDNEDKWDMRNNGILKSQRLLYSESGCMIDYKDIIKYLPNGIHANEAYKQKMSCHMKDTSKKIVEVMEYVHSNYICHGKFPIAQKYNYETYKNEIQEDHSLNYSILKRERICDRLQVGAFLLQNRLPAEIDFTEYYNYLDTTRNEYNFSQTEIINYCNSAETIRNKLIIQQKELLMNDPIDQSFLLKALYEEQNWNEILGLHSDKVLCDGPYHYYLGMIYKASRNNQAALNNFVLFLKETHSHSYDKYPQENIAEIRNAYNFIFRMYNGENIDALEFANLCLALFGSEYEYKIDFNLRNKALNFLPKIAEKLRAEYTEISYQCLLLYVTHTSHYNLEPRSKRIRNLEHSKEFRLGKKLLWLPNKIHRVFYTLKRGKQCLNDHGLKYTTAYALKKLKSNISTKISTIKKHFMTCTPFKIISIFNKKVLTGYKQYEKMISEYGENAFLFLSAIGTGDTYLHAMFFNNYADKIAPEATRVFGVWSNASNKIARLFNIDNIACLSTDEMKNFLNLYMFVNTEDLKMKCMHYHIFHRHTGILTFIEGLHDFNYFSLTEAYLELYRNDTEKPKFIYDDVYLENEFEKNHLVAGKTIVLSPYAKTVKSIPSSFWNKLAQNLIANGFYVCTNSVGQEELPVEGTVPVLVPFENTVPFIEKAGVIIGLRSGLLDIVNTANCLKISLNTWNNYVRSPIYHIADSFSLSSMYNEAEQFDLMYDATTEDMLISEIVQLVSEKLLSNNERGETNEIIC